MINLIKKKLTEELLKYDLKLINLEAGILNVHVLKYEEREEELFNLIANIEKDESVTKVTRNGGDVSIYFKQSDILKPQTLMRWKEIFKDYV